ncbi:hypothetical protein MMC17_006782 [Xylographa soralifera]|nr:hypothetical protein [Xylographa soralifera]
MQSLLSLLKTGFPENAFDDAQFVLEDKNCDSISYKTRWKAHFRAAQALSSLQRFQESLVYLKTMLELATKREGPDKEATKLVSERILAVEQRLQEQEHGKYDFLQMARAVSKNKLLLDQATYVGPVQIRETKDRSRGLLLAKAVEAGKLLLREKAFAAVYEDPDYADKLTLVNGNKSFRNPFLATPLLSLYNASISDAKLSIIDEKPIIDSYLLERITALNCFGCPISSSEDPLTRRTHQELESSSFSNSVSPQGRGSAGIWVRASSINDDCVPNGHRPFIGDMMTVRAASPTSVNTELTFTYMPSDHECAKRRDAMEHWGWVCDCSLCVMDKLLPRNLLWSQTKILKETKAMLSLLQIVPSAANNTYSIDPTQPPRTATADSLLVLALAFYEREEYSEAETYILCFFVALGFKFAVTATSFQVTTWGLVIEPTVTASQFSGARMVTLS